MKIYFSVIKIVSRAKNLRESTYSFSHGQISLGEAPPSVPSSRLWPSPLVEAARVKLGASVFTSTDSLFFSPVTEPADAVFVCFFRLLVDADVGFMVELEANKLSAAAAIAGDAIGGDGGGCWGCSDPFCSPCSLTVLTLMITGVVLLADNFRPPIKAVIERRRGCELLELQLATAISSSLAPPHSLSLAPAEGFESNERNGVPVKSSVEDTDGRLLPLDPALAAFTADEERRLNRLMVSWKPQLFFSRSVTSTMMEALTSEDELESRNVEFLREEVAATSAAAAGAESSPINEQGWSRGLRSGGASAASHGQTSSVFHRSADSAVSLRNVKTLC